jgi:hypothetical protein
MDQSLTDNKSRRTVSTTPKPSAAQQLVGDITPKLAEPTVDVLFGDVWARPELPAGTAPWSPLPRWWPTGAPNSVSHLRLAKVLVGGPRFEPEPPLPTLVSGDIALTSTIAKDGTGVRVQVVRRQPDGSWLRLLDQPELASTP